MFMKYDGKMNKVDFENITLFLLFEVFVLFPLPETKYLTCSEFIKRLMQSVHVPFCSWHPSIHVLLLLLVFHTHSHTGPCLALKSETGHIPAQLWWPAELCVVLCLGLGPSHSTHPTGHPLASCGPFHVQEAGVNRKRRRRGMSADSLSFLPSVGHICVKGA